MPRIPTKPTACVLLFDAHLCYYSPFPRPSRASGEDRRCARGGADGRRRTQQILLSAAAPHGISIGIGEKVIWANPFGEKQLGSYTRLTTTWTDRPVKIPLDQDDGTPQSATEPSQEWDASRWARTIHAIHRAACAPPARPR